MTPEVEQLADEFRQPKLHEVVCRFLAATLTEPTLIHVEDAHLMDGASGDLFAYVLRDIAERPWLCSLTRRETGTGFVAPADDRVRSITLEPLAHEDLITLIEAATEDAPLLPHDVSLVADRSGGNPQFGLDLVQVVASGAMLPESIETAAMARIDALAPADRALVRRASVLGTTFHRRFLAEVLDEDAPAPDDETWARLGEFFVEDGEDYLRFRRAIVRDAAYTGLPFRTRRALHARVAVRFEDEFNPEETGGLLSLHFFLAGNNEKAWGYARHAAKRASDQYAHQEAAKLYERAIDAAKHLAGVAAEELAAAFEALGEARYRASEYTRAATAFSTAAKRVDDPVVKARLLLHLAWIEENRGRYPQALRWITRGLKILEGQGGSEAESQRSRLLQFRATILLAQGRTARSVEWAERAVEAAQAAEDPVALARAYDSLDWANVSLGRPSGAYWSQALQIYREAGDLGGESGILLNLGFGSFYEGRWEEALASYEGAKEGRLKVGDPVMAALAADNIAEILCEQGYFDEAETSLRESLRVWRASGNRVMLANCLEVLSRVTSRTGRFEEALTQLEESRAGFAEAGAREEVARADARVAECHVLMEDAKTALDLATTALEASTSSGEGGMSVSLLERIRGYASAQLGEMDEARADLESSLKVARDRGEEYDVALSLMALARLDGLADLQLVQEAGDILTRLGVIAVPVMALAAAPMPGRATTG